MKKGQNKNIVIIWHKATQNEYDDKCICLSFDTSIFLYTTTDYLKWIIWVANLPQEYNKLIKEASFWIKKQVTGDRQFMLTLDQDIGVFEKGSISA